MPEFTLVAKATVTASICAPDARVALARWQAWRKRKPVRRLCRGAWLEIDGGRPIVIDQDGGRVQVTTGDWEDAGDAEDRQTIVRKRRATPTDQAAKP